MIAVTSCQIIFGHRVIAKSRGRKGVAEHLAWREQKEADRLQAVLSSVKIFLALLPEGSKFELKAPKLNAEAPADRLGVRVRLPAAAALDSPWRAAPAAGNRG